MSANEPRTLLDQAVRVRFAPSPTGRMHVGNARTALINWLFTRAHGGEMLLRMDDTDAERSTKENEDQIYKDLDWLGLDWDDFARQSARHDRYDLATDKLKASGRLYACYETPEELELKRKIQLGQGRPPVYDRAALDLSPEEHQAFLAEGRQPHWRFKLLDAPVAWDDLGRGHVHFEPGSLSDPVLIRNDGRPLYTISSVVDDGETRISHVVRGEDHVVNTAVQVQLFEALDFPVPTFAHLPLMVGADGRALSKRIGSLALHDLRDQGIEPNTINAYLAHLGASIAPDGTEDLTALVKRFDIAGYGRASPRFDMKELEALNAKVVHHLSFDSVRNRLAADGLAAADEAFWNAIRGNVGTVAGAGHWWRVVAGEIEPLVADEDRAFLKDAAAHLPDGLWDQDTWGVWTGAVKQATGRKGKQLFMPLRRALTGREQGPDIKDLLPLIDRDRVLARLS
ncbi:MAG: glutamate--tRNA ligase [Alphaproteobacteria bacterium]|nr:glutamate--tRNA ligase [Alphaproteobacteria bacterium]